MRNSADNTKPGNAKQVRFAIFSMAMVPLILAGHSADAATIAGDRNGASVSAGIGPVSVGVGPAGGMIGTGTKFGHTFHAGPMDVTPSVEVGVGYSDNIFASEAVRRSSTVGFVSPGLELGVDGDDSSFTMGYRLDKNFVFASRQDDTVDHSVYSNYSVNLTDRLYAAISGGYFRSHDQRGATFTGLGFNGGSPDKYREIKGGLTIGYGRFNRIEWYGDISNKRYYNNRFRILPAGILPATVTRDLDTIGTGVGFSWQMMPKTHAVLEARYAQFDYKWRSPIFNLNSSEQRYFAGFDWDATAKTDGRLRLGYTHKGFKDRTLNTDFSGFGAEVGVTWHPRTYSTFDLSVAHEPSESDGLGSFIKTTGGRLIWTHEWAKRFSHTANAGLSKDKYVGRGINRLDHVYTAGAGISYQLFYWLRIGLTYGYELRNSNVVNASYHGSNYGFNFAASL